MRMGRVVRGGADGGTYSTRPSAEIGGAHLCVRPNGGADGVDPLKRASFWIFAVVIVPPP